MSYLSLLQGLRNQPSNFDAFVQGVNEAGQSFAKGLADDREQRRKLAQEQAGLIQKRAGAMLQAGQNQQAAELLPQFREAVKTGWDLSLPNTTIVGAPVMGQVPDPDFIGPMPKGQTAMKRGEVGRDFGGEQTLNAIRGGLMLEPPKPMKVEAGETYVDPITRKVLFEGKPKPGKLVPSYNADGTITYKEADEGLTVGAKPTTPRLFMSYGPDGKATLVQGEPGVTLGVKPSAERDNSAAMRQWQTGRVKFIEDFIKSRASQLPMTMVLQDPTSTRTQRLDRPTRETPTQAQINAWRKEAATIYETNVTRPFEQPDGGQAAPAVRGVRTSVITPPTDFNDTRLQPEWETLAKQAAALAPGAVVSSRARSKERNAQAGGVDNSWHRYRQAFDLVVPRREDRAKLIQWGRQKGLEVIDEGDHLHFEPARSSDAMRNFYAKHGLESDDA